MLLVLSVLTLIPCLFLLTWYFFSTGGKSGGNKKNDGVKVSPGLIEPPACLYSRRQECLGWWTVWSWVPAWPRPFVLRPCISGSLAPSSSHHEIHFHILKAKKEKQIPLPKQSLLLRVMDALTHVQFAWLTHILIISSHSCFLFIKRRKKACAFLLPSYCYYATVISGK